MMGNSCCSSVEESSTTSSMASTSPHDSEYESLLSIDHHKYHKNYRYREMKDVKDTRKQLEELLAKAEELGISADQVLARLKRNRDHCEMYYQRSWSPVLQTIPEVN